MKDRAGWVNEVKNRSGKCEGPGDGGGDQRLFEKNFFLKKPKTSTKHCRNNTPVHYAQGSH